MERLTVQAFIDNAWQDIAELGFPESDQDNYLLTRLDYASDYGIDYMDCDDHHAVSVNYPVRIFFDDGGEPGWMRFLDDIIPAGASRQYWIDHLDLSGLSRQLQDYILLRHATIAPVGNLRIKESIPVRHEGATRFFSVEDVKNRAADFLDYAQQRGAAAGGATGAGGEAPKLLLRCNADDQVWIDTWQDENDCRDTAYLVKFPRGQRSEIDCDILRAEFHYYHELAAMGFDTIPLAGMRLEEGRHYPSLWLPRFDIGFSGDGRVKRYGMESVYSLLRAGPGSALRHDQTLRAVIAKIAASHTVSVEGKTFDPAAFVIEWVRRDVLNIAFGNSDNHGRNTAFLKDEQGIRLAPIYDFAPMKADPAGIARTTKWPEPLEIGGEYQFEWIAELLSDMLPPALLMEKLCETAVQLVGLKARLQARGVPESILTMPSIGFDYLPGKLQRWGLL
ncbi:type II toxin-antitoxin system HipA family toxin [Dickeya dianthicola]|uniref:type II toxin-antitoxin system HipA family toxin n=1 Tax=Dickeya dianthicola TaxID=204039 RepID=UPI001371ED5B|nr:HipA domain-containing protein [Dickeya dianthicola]MCI4236731.1 HipA domain-containing protein [Dickeya dianthicola]MCI4255043.1 HipA domain-containing protein [Dickeya dianthicola]MZG21545.1 type II toxin-antitoxin system HipA family toxin [Dickeya dianthicola]MZI90521.1 type II toxin-antitoxin system HipA family toxin [Dickeya dianthicola]